MPNRVSVVKKTYAAALLLVSPLLTGACSDWTPDGAHPFPVKDTAWHSLDMNTDYMELEHGWLVRRVSALTFVPFPSGWKAAGSGGYAGNPHAAGEVGDEE
jgi:hypothetical protein